MMTFIVNVVLVESEGELEVCLPLRHTAKSRKKGWCIVHTEK